MDRSPERRVVSYHAVVRYVQRVLGVVVDCASGNFECAQHHCDAAGRTIDEVTPAIMTPGVKLAIDMGLPEIGSRSFIAIVAQPAGVVTTILEARTRSDQRLRVLSDREFRQRSKKIHRKEKRRPVSRIAEEIEP